MSQWISSHTLNLPLRRYRGSTTFILLWTEYYSLLETRRYSKTISPIFRRFWREERQISSLLCRSVGFTMIHFSTSCLVLHLLRRNWALSLLSLLIGWKVGLILLTPIFSPCSLVPRADSNMMLKSFIVNLSPILFYVFSSRRLHPLLMHPCDVELWYYPRRRCTCDSKAPKASTCKLQALSSVFQNSSMYPPTPTPTDTWHTYEPSERL